MSERIDAELERVTKLGQAPKAIEVGDDLYNELDEEQNGLPAAPILGADGKAPVYAAPEEVIEYKGIRVIRKKDAPKDYLNILT